MRDHHLTLKYQNTTYQGSSIRRVSTWVDIINQDTNDLQPDMPAGLFPHLGKSNYHLYVKITCQTTLGDHYGRKKRDILFFVLFLLSANNKIKHYGRYLVKYKQTRSSFSAGYICFVNTCYNWACIYYCIFLYCYAEKSYSVSLLRQLDRQLKNLIARAMITRNEII